MEIGPSNLPSKPFACGERGYERRAHLVRSNNGDERFLSRVLKQYLSLLQSTIMELLCLNGKHGYFIVHILCY